MYGPDRRSAADNALHHTNLQANLSSVTAPVSPPPQVLLWLCVAELAVRLIGTQSVALWLLKAQLPALQRKARKP